jgi:hypothetical protein
MKRNRKKPKRARRLTLGDVLDRMAHVVKGLEKGDTDALGDLHSLAREICRESGLPLPGSQEWLAHRMAALTKKAGGALLRAARGYFESHGRAVCLIELGVADSDLAIRFAAADEVELAGATANEIQQFKQMALAELKTYDPASEILCLLTTSKVVSMAFGAPPLSALAVLSPQEDAEDWPADLAVGA